MKVVLPRGHKNLVLAVLAIARRKCGGAMTWDLPEPRNISREHFKGSGTLHKRYYTVQDPLIFENKVVLKHRDWSQFL